MHWAAERGDVAVVAALLEAGASPSAVSPSRRGVAPVHVAAHRGRLEVLRALIDAGADPAVVDRDGLTPLHWAALAGELETVRALLSTRRFSPLELAIDHQHAEVARVLLRDRSPEAAELDRLLDVALMRRPRLIALLLDHGADLRRASPQVPPVVVAVREGDLALLDRALAAGCEVDASFNQATPLNRLVQAAPARLVELEPVVARLLDAGADPRAKDRAGLDATDHLSRTIAAAEKSGQPEVAARLARLLDRMGGSQAPRPEQALPKLPPIAWIAGASRIEPAGLAAHHGELFGEEIDVTELSVYWRTRDAVFLRRCTEQGQERVELRMALLGDPEVRRGQLCSLSRLLCTFASLGAERVHLSSGVSAPPEQVLEKLRRAGEDSVAVGAFWVRIERDGEYALTHGLEIFDLPELEVACGADPEAALAMVRELSERSLERGALCRVGDRVGADGRVREGENGPWLVVPGRIPPNEEQRGSLRFVRA